MTTASSFFQVGGSLQAQDPTYIRRQADEELYQGLMRGEFCYVFNTRQIGKSSLRVRVKHRLEAQGCCCASIDLTNLGSQSITADQWYKGIAAELWRSFQCSGSFQQWWRQDGDLPATQHLDYFIQDVLLERLSAERIVIFIDEIDSVLGLPFATDDLFTLIRYCYNQRVDTPAYRRITFALFGVATPTDLIQNHHQTPFNIGTAIALGGFTPREASPLARWLTPQVANPAETLGFIFSWTGGQPFLTQKLCQLVVTQLAGRTAVTVDQEWVDGLVRSQVVKNWESKDEPPHLRTIQDRLLHRSELTSRLLGHYRRLLLDEELRLEGSIIQDELLLSGLVTKKDGQLRIQNRLYRSVFDQGWVDGHLARQRPYSQAFTAWINSGQTDRSRLLRGQSLVEAQTWAKHQQLSDLDYKFLADSDAVDRQEMQQFLEAERLKAVEARLKTQQRHVILQRIFLCAIAAIFLMAAGLGLLAYRQSRQTQLTQQDSKSNQALSASYYSESLFNLDRSLQALLEAVRAARQLQQLPSPRASVQQQVEQNLRRTLQGIAESNQLRGHRAAVNRVGISPDGRYIVSASDDATLRLWQTNGRPVTTLAGHQGAILDFDISADGQYLVSGSDDKTIRLWQLDGPQTVLLDSLFNQHGAITAVSFSIDGKLVATGDEAGHLRLWNLDGQMLLDVQGHSDRITQIVPSPDGQTFVTASEDSTVKLWDAGTGRLISTFEGHSAPVYGLAFSPDGTRLASTSDDATIRLWKLEGGLSITLEGHQHQALSVQFSPDGKYLATASRDHTIKLWNPEGTLLTTLKGHEATPRTVVFSPDSHTLISGGEDATVRLWRFDSLPEVLDGYQGPVASVAVAAKLVAGGSWDRSIRLWNLDGQLRGVFNGHRDRVWDIDLHPDGRTLASASWDGTVKLWQLDGSRVKTLAGHRDRVKGVRFSPDGRSLASTGWDGTIRLWSTEGQLTHILKGHRSRVYGVAYSPDRRHLVSGSWDHTVKIWDPIQGRLLKSLYSHRAPVWSLAVSPDGQQIASASADNTVKLWTMDGRLLTTLQGHQGAVHDVAYSPDGQVIASGSYDRTVRLWQRDGTPLSMLRGHSGPVRGVAFSQDGQRLITSGHDRKILVWRWQRAQNFEELLDDSCRWLENYLRYGADLSRADRQLCIRSLR